MRGRPTRNRFTKTRAPVGHKISSDSNNTPEAIHEDEEGSLRLLDLLDTGLVSLRRVGETDARKSGNERTGARVERKIEVEMRTRRGDTHLALGHGGKLIVQTNEPAVQKSHGRQPGGDNGQPAERKPT